MSEPRTRMLADIEALLRTVRAAGEWEAGMGPGRWGCRPPGDDLKHGHESTRDAALAAARRDGPTGGAVDLIEARCWNDDITAGDDVERFAVSRKAHTVRFSAKTAGG